MQKPNWKKIWEITRKYLLNKYILTLCIFAVVLTFCGEQSLLNRAKRSVVIAEKEAELREYQQKTSAAKAQMDSLNESTENLEKFAREKYHMHADGENVFLIEE